MKIKIIPSAAKGEISAPPSKSYAHRMIICAALSEGESIINGFSENEDISATLDCIKVLGAGCKINGDRLIITGIIKKNTEEHYRKEKVDFPEANKTMVFPCRESGSTLRFFIPLSLVLGERSRFEGSERLMQRGIDVYKKIFAGKGIICENKNVGIEFSGKLSGGKYVLPGDVSSQFVSGLLFALPILGEDSIIKVLPPVESRGYIDITIDVLSNFGIKIEEPEKNIFIVKGSQKYIRNKVTVEGDWSNGAVLLALGELSGHVDVLGLNARSLQGDCIVTQMLEKLNVPGEVIDISDCPDLGPVLFSVAAAKHGATFTGTRRLRIKESDRAAAMAEELNKFGIKVTVEENSVTVHEGILKTPTVSCKSHYDHRIVMAITLLGTLVGCEIENAEAIAKSYPEFFSVLRSLGIKMETENEI